MKLRPITPLNLGSELLLMECVGGPSKPYSVATECPHMETCVYGFSRTDELQEIIYFLNKN